MLVGGISLTVISTVVVSLPPEFSAVIVYVAVEDTTVGVPVITPVVGLNTKPVGRLGETVHETTVPPLFVGASGDIVVSLVSVNGEPL